MPSKLVNGYEDQFAMPGIVKPDRLNLRERRIGCCRRAREQEVGHDLEKVGPRLGVLRRRLQVDQPTTGDQVAVRAAHPGRMLSEGRVQPKPIVRSKLLP